jgi:succinyl-diaminopimelate desuccinylase
MHDTERSTLLAKITELEASAVSILSDLIAINSVGPKNDGPGERGKAAYLESLLKKMGFKDTGNYPAPDKSAPGGSRPNLVARIPGKDRSRTFWVIAHMDVVPEGDRKKWHTDPFKAAVKDGKVFGRGSEDNLQGLISGLTMARAFIETEITPPVDIALAFVSDEETGSAYGLGYLLQNHEKLFGKKDLIVIPDAGESDGSMIEIAEKSILWLKLTTIGKQVHASLPQLGINAFRAASKLVVMLDRLHQDFPGKDTLFEPPISTFEPTKKEANVPNVNTIPGEDVFYLDCRILPDYKIEAVIRAVREISDQVEKEFGVTIEISSEQKEQAAPATDVKAPVIGLLQKGIREIYGIDPRPQGIGGGTVAALFRRKGYPVVVWSKLDDMAHQPDEYCRIENLTGDAKVLALAVLEA